ncbi:ABC transporter permease [Thermodesulfatator autotrophicus]|uniref:Iron export ABC transporter permease subunit FetB n=1 Tax=Thermodesulfatator autotrophicus TaxID=1795632 RepID=A0A177E9F8_9BACT|nr:iron export ABC transporter permease subunit FetB [Thermodesulfatator autotrophicus]OAG28050.1 hypothetical protein TH606_03745 [Thermodesulfatator autotrophicus]
MSQFITLSPLDLALASGFILLAGALSLYLRLKIEKRLFIAALRTIIQLSLVGFILETIFSLKNPFLVVGLLFFMALVAGREAAFRSRKRYALMVLDTTLSMSLSALIVGVIVTQVIVGVKPWYHPQYVIPLIGMILGNSLNGVSLALDTFIDYLMTRKKEIELFLAYGANHQEAINQAFRAAVARGLVPIINAMSVAGIVSLPGMMTGQILAGTPPLQAVAYQILVMFMLAGAYTIGAISAVWLAGKRLFSAEPRFKEEIFS